MHRRRGANGFICQPRMRVLVAAVIVEDAACDDAQVFGEVKGGGDDEQAEEEEKHRVYGTTLA